MNYLEKYKDCLEYIDSYWDEVTYRPSREIFAKHIIKLPQPFITPNVWRGKYPTQFYWDSYFIFRGIMGTKRAWIMKDMVENFIYFFNTFDIIPNSNHAGMSNRSQPPFLTSMILDVFSTPHAHTKVGNGLAKMLPLIHNYRNKQWLRHAMEVAKKEYLQVWIDVDDEYNHHVKGYNLSRYGDRDIGYALSSELESGWDLTSRFYNRCNDFLPIDLNVFLYKYEKDFATVAPLFPDWEDDRSYWEKTSENRKNDINKHMWNDKVGFFFDHGHRFGRMSEFLSLAGFTPMWAGLATAKQAEKMVKMLPKFETDYGLTITAKESLAEPIDLSKIQKRYHQAIHDIVDPKQWDYPNIWPNYQYMTVIGLLRYGYVDSATRIMKKALEAQFGIFKKYKTFFEKFNGITGDKTENFHYENQKGFGWTNAEFYRYVQILQDLENGTNIYIDPKPQQPPYDLSILH